jgi:hypothetical protein
VDLWGYVCQTCARIYALIGRTSSMTGADGRQQYMGRTCRTDRCPIQNENEKYCFHSLFRCVERKYGGKKYFYYFLLENVCVGEGGAVCNRGQIETLVYDFFQK